MPEVRIDVYTEEHGSTKKLNNVEAALGGVEGRSGKTHSSLGGLWKQFAAGQIAANLLTQAIGTLKDFIGSSIQSAMDAEVSENNLRAALETTGRSVQDMLPHFIAYSGELQKQTIYEDDAIQKAQALLVQLTDLDQNGIDKATKGAMGMASVFKMDLESAATLVGKAMAGNTAALSRYGITVDANLPKEEKQRALLEQLVGFYGRAQAETNTFSGTLKQLGNMWDEVKEAAGGAIINNDQVKKTIKSLKDEIVNLLESGKIAEWANAAGRAISGMASCVTTLIEGFADLRKGGIQGIFNQIAEKISGTDKIYKDAFRAAHAQMMEFQGSLVNLKIPMEDIREEAMKGPAAWADYTARMREVDEMMGKNKGTISGWIDKGLEALGLKKNLADESGKLGGKTAELTKLFKDLGQKTRTELTKELKNAQEELVLLKSSTEATPAAIGALEDKIKKLKEGLFGATKETKELKEQLGITTQADLQDKLKKLNQALLEYKGQLTYNELRKLKSAINDIYLEMASLADMPKPTVGKDIFEDLSKIKTAFPGISDTYEKIKGGLGDISGKSKNATEEMGGHFSGLYNDIATGFGDSASGLIGEICNGLNFADMKFFEHGINFKKYFGEAFDSVKDAFFRMVGEMVSEKVLGMFKGLFSKVKNEGSDVLSKISGAGKDIASSAGSAASGFLSALGSVGSIITGITSVISLLQGPQKQTDVTYWLKLIKDLTQEAHDWLFLNAQDKLDYFAEKLEDIKQTVLDIRNPANAICDKLDWIGGMVDTIKGYASSLKNITKAQTGYEGIVTGPKMFFVEPGITERVSIRQESKAGSAAAAAQNITVSPNIVFNINALDGADVEKTVRLKIKPILQRYFDKGEILVPLGAMKGY